MHSCAQENFMGYFPLSVHLCMHLCSQESFMGRFPLSVRTCVSPSHSCVCLTPLSKNTLVHLCMRLCSQENFMAQFPCHFNFLAIEEIMYIIFFLYHHSTTLTLSPLPRLTHHSPLPPLPFLSLSLTTPFLHRLCHHSHTSPFFPLRPFPHLPHSFPLTPFSRLHHLRQHILFFIPRLLFLSFPYPLSSFFFTPSFLLLCFLFIPHFLYNPCQLSFIFRSIQCFVTP